MNMDFNDEEKLNKLKMFQEKLSRMFEDFEKRNKQRLEERILPVITVKSCLLSPACLLQIIVFKAPTDGAYAYEYDNPHLTGPSNKIKLFLN